MPKRVSMEMIGQFQDTYHLICRENQHVELEEMVDLLKLNPSQENDDLKDRGLIL